MKETLTQKQMQIGLEAWAELNFDQFPGVIAARYGVGIEDVEECKEETVEIHKALCVLFGHEYYWEELSLTAYFQNKKAVCGNVNHEDDDL